MGTIPNGVTLPQARNAYARYRERYGRSASPDELVAFIAIEETMERERFVRVVFPGTVQRYTYSIDPNGSPVGIGDYLQVYSPMTDQSELVRVVELGRGPWTGPAKQANRINWKVING